MLAMKPSLILTANPNFIDLAQAELQRSQPGSSLIAELAAGVWLVYTPDHFYRLAEEWQRQPPIFVRHINPVLATLPISGTRHDLANLSRFIKREFIDLIDPQLSFSVQTRLLANTDYKPFDLNSSTSEMIQRLTGAPLNVRAPVQVMSLVIGPSQAYLGLSLAAHNLSNWAGGAHRFAREKGQISRAEFKLLEALAVFQISLPPRGIALDLGAAPGGWTRVLRQHEQYVTAVDPASLHRSLNSDVNVRHQWMTAEAYLADDPDRFDMIVNDMRQDARDSARLMVDYHAYLYSHGIAIMTFKLPENGRDRVLDHAFSILRRAYQIAGARQLFHNRSEITVFLRPQGTVSNT
jgi:23S rRNA (cytidine2498-2'-O)-methyltransferase